MSSLEWRPDDSKENPDAIPFGDALAALAVEDAPDADPVAAVRESRENV